MEQENKAQNIALSGILIAIAVIFGTFSIPIGAAKISPVQHFVNVVGAITLGPFYAFLNGFISALLRNLLGTGSLLAFPGSMFGGVIAGFLYKKFNKEIFAVCGEIIGTGIIGGMIAYPVASFLMGKQAALFTYVIPFLFSCSFGAAMAYIFIKVPTINRFLVKKSCKVKEI